MCNIRWKRFISTPWQTAWHALGLTEVSELSGLSCNRYVIISQNFDAWLGRTLSAWPNSPSTHVIQCFSIRKLLRSQLVRESTNQKDFIFTWGWFGKHSQKMGHQAIAQDWIMSPSRSGNIPWHNRASLSTGLIEGPQDLEHLKACWHKVSACLIQE